MKKIILAEFLFLFLCSNLFSHQFEVSKIGNVVLCSYSTLKQIHDMADKIPIFSADEHYREYDSLVESCGNNKLLIDKKLEEEFANKLQRICGFVYQVRRSILNEYIVELRTSEAWSWNVKVVYPKQISQAMINELLSLKEGDYFEAIVLTRATYLYVDVPVWNQSGVYRTEP